MLIADSRYDEAETCIEAMKSIDYWSMRYIYDEAELLYRKDEEAAIRYMEERLELVIDGMVEGIGLFLRSPYHKEVDETADGIGDAQLRIFSC